MTPPTRVIAWLTAGTVVLAAAGAGWALSREPNRKPLPGVPGKPFAEGGSTMNIYVTATEPFDFMGRHWDYGATTFASVTKQIEAGYFSDRGITNLMMYGPYASTGQWRGLPATGDLMDFDPANGTLDDWREMVTAANDRGITVTMYIALLYLHATSPIFVQAEKDRAAGTDSWHSRLFLWDEREPNGETPPSQPPLESQIERPMEGDWAFSEVAQRWYATSWQHPALNYESPATMEFAHEVLRFWMDNGVQGFELDAPQTMWGFQEGGVDGVGELRHAELVRYPQEYRPEWQVRVTAEGMGTFDAQAAMDRIGYTDIMLNADSDDYSFALGAAADPPDLTLDELEAHYVSFLDHRRLLGRTSSAPATQSDQPGALRAFNLAVQGGSGALISIDQQMLIDALPAPDVQALFDVTTALAASPAEAPGARRERVPASPAASGYALLRTSADGSASALNVFNFAATPTEITVDLTGSDVRPSQPTTDLRTGEPGPAIRDGSLTVTIPGHGWLFLDVAADPPAATTMVDSAADAWGTGSDWAEVPDRSAYGGGRIGGSTTDGFAEIAFTGTGIEVRGPVGPGGAAEVEIFIDGVSQGTHSQLAEHTRHGVLLFRATGLAAGEHTIRIEKRDAGKGFAGIDYVHVHLKG
ncbi:alpha-amylase family glycosyl hydrolase [Pseudolysinimonas yzui]|uniref:Glycosyl hydrolase family 13 catalytic domain-containing protein n=1 Tax=Pseudolysinimonas yzui TaxID=2708254 RepID=A0A8J3GPX9_9MICO|nr:alpha-amylase family glycosyl hydrolase [Pseudolysinimonas yzui]GHF13213.1 hypothetical protein GCM10011600_12520 [Pseudolysinimonas yzui]